MFLPSELNRMLHTISSDVKKQRTDNIRPLWRLSLIVLFYLKKKWSNPRRREVIYWHMNVMVFCIPLYDPDLISPLAEETEAADGPVDPSVEGREPRVNTGQVGASTSDAEADDANLEPLAVLLAHQWPTSVSL